MKSLTLPLITVLSEYTVLAGVPYRVAGGRELTADIYLPCSNINRMTGEMDKAAKPLITVVFFHGGGWVEGSRSSCVLRILPYLQKGWAVVNVEYRLAGEALAPAAVEDARAAVWWVKRQSELYGFDTDRIILTGESAGGHLALIAGLLPAKSGFDNSHAKKAAGSAVARRTDAELPELKVACIINWSGVTHVEDVVTGNNPRVYALAWMGCQDNLENLAKRVSPASYVRDGLCPILTLHGDQDVVVPYAHAVDFHRLLSTTNTVHELYTIKNREHFDYRELDWRNAFEKIDDFLERVLE